MKKEVYIPIIILLLIIVTLKIYNVRLIGKVNKVEISHADEDLGIKPLVFEDETITEEEISEVINIALFGLDKRDSFEIGRSDSIMIASLDQKNKKIKLTSVMRDTYVDIPGIGMDKINHAYAFGGPELSLKTMNQNFNMNIRDFAAVDFDGLEHVIDVLGGVEVTLNQDETRFVLGSKAGTQILTGEQALAYSRIRKTGNADFERTERQRTILECVIHKGLGAGITQYPKLLHTMLPYVDTSLSTNEILQLGSSIFTSNIKDIEQFRIPVDGHAQGERINDIYYLVPDTLEDNIKLLHQFIFGM